MTIPNVYDTRFIMEQQPRITGLIIRRPRPDEHPLTLDMRIGNSTKEIADEVVRAWQQACADVGQFIPFIQDEEQQRLIHEFWDRFDISCLHPSEEFETISDNEAKVVLRFNTNPTTQIEEQKKLEESKKIENLS